MSRYDDILKRNEQLIDNVYEMNEEITDLAYENEELTKENEELSVDNEELFEENASMKKGIAELHKSSARRFRSNRPRTQKMYYEEPKEEVQQNVQHRKDCNCNQVVHNDSQHRVISLFISEKTKKSIMFGILIFLILLLGLGIEPGTAITYESLLDCYLELVFNLYNLCILGTIGFILRKIWKKL